MGSSLLRFKKLPSYKVYARKNLLSENSVPKTLTLLLSIERIHILYIKKSKNNNIKINTFLTSQNPKEPKSIKYI